MFLQYLEEKYKLSDERLAICKACDRYALKYGQGQCLECGCFMAYKTKMKSASCPLGKWNAVEDK